MPTNPMLFIEGRHVRMDAKKTRAEMYPARIVHRMAEVLADIEATMTSPSEIVKFHASELGIP